MSKVSRIAFILAVAALVSCVDENGGGNGITPEDPTEENTSNLTTVQLASFAGDASRVSYPVTRAEGDETDAEGEVAGDAEDEIKPGTLRLIASIDNPSKDAGFFVPEDGGRYMSATSVYYDEGSDTYYVTYHIQGNNYNTTLDTSTAGAIQSFKIAEDGTVTLGTGFRAQNPSQEDFDFNHIYFDRTDQRILAVGHNVKGGNQDNTNAIVGIFNPTEGTYTYSTVKTGEKDYDDDGKSLGYKDAGDVNSILRPNDIFNTPPAGWNFYLLATRKGLAAVKANDSNLFEPILDAEGNNYFIPTPGSAKSIIQGTAGSYFGLLYLSENTSEKPEAYTTSSEAKIAHFAINTTTNNMLRSLMTPATAPFNQPFSDDITTPSQDVDAIVGMSGQTDLPAEISPIDGKNTLYALPAFSDEEYYAALGTSGLYYHFRGNSTNKVFEGVKKFGNRPVNNVFADREVTGEGIIVEGSRVGHDGFLYVANGSKLTVLHRHTMEELASWNMPSDIASSANFITVTSGPVGDNGLSERTIAVAFGQAGVKIFKFMPDVKTVWERDIE